MPRPPTARIESIRRELIIRLHADGLTSGAPFFSQRGLARHYGISPQTAFRLLDELRKQGKLVRKKGAGTRLPGAPPAHRQVVLCFAQRARIKGSFGATLLEHLGAALTKAGVPWRVRWAPGVPKSRDLFPVLWTPGRFSPEEMPECRFALLLHDEPPPGIAASYIDSVTVDDFGGGAAAGEILRDRFLVQRPVFLAGPANDPRSQRRGLGFRSVHPDVRVVVSGGWFRESGQEAFGVVKGLNPDGVFCANDRLAEGLSRAARAHGWKLPALIGFDDAPIARQIGLSTIAIPWTELARTATAIVLERFRGSQAAAGRVIISPRPVLR